MVRPMLRAVPAIIFMAESTVKQLRSGILLSAMARTCSQVTVPTFFPVGFRRTFTGLKFGRFEELDGSRRSFDDKVKRFVPVHRNNHRKHFTLLLLRLRVKALAELHDIHAFGTEYRTNRRSGVGLATLYLEFDINIYFFCHWI